MTERDPYTWDNGQNAPDWLTEWVRRMLELRDTIEGDTMTEVQAVEDGGVKALTAQDRCDRCGAQALVLVCIPSVGGVLLFCGHHATRHGVALAEQGAVILADDRG